MHSDWIRTTTSSGARKLALALIALAVLAGGAHAAVHRGAKQGPFSISVARGGGQIAAGAVTRYRLLIDRHGPTRGRASKRAAHPRHGFVGPVTLSVAALPRGASASFGPRQTRGSISVLTVRTSASTPASTYRLLVRGRSGRHQANTSLRLVVSRPTNPSAAPGPAPTEGSHAPSTSPQTTPVASPPPAAVTTPPSHPFTLILNLAGVLVPGVSLPLNATVTNPDAVELSVSSLSVSVSAVSAPNADSAHPCAVSDFAVVQFSGAHGFTVPAASTASLADLGYAPAQWPSVEMLDRPVDQDGCKGASLTLGYSAAAGQAAG